MDISCPFQDLHLLHKLLVLALQSRIHHLVYDALMLQLHLMQLPGKYTHCFLGQVYMFCHYKWLEETVIQSKILLFPIFSKEKKLNSVKWVKYSGDLLKNEKYSKMRNPMLLTWVFWNASSAVHSARLVGFDNANTIGRSWNLAISWRISGVNSPGVADAPIIIYFWMETLWWIHLEQ